MATIGGLSGGTSNSVSMYGTTMKGYGGLASGLDTDSLIQGMTQGTRTKIQEALKKKDKYQWQMDSYRSISDKLISFNKKYLNVADSNSPYRAGFFDKSLVTAHGLNSKYLSVSGTSSTLENMSVLGIKQLAKDTSLVAKEDSSIQALNTGNINFGTTMVSELDGGVLNIKYGDHTYNLQLTEGAKVTYRDPRIGDFVEGTMDFSTEQDSRRSIEALLNSVNYLDANGKTVDANRDGDGDPTTNPGDVVKLGSKISFGLRATGSPVTDYNFAIEHSDPTDTTTLNIAGGSEDALKALGFMKSDGTFVNDGKVDTGTQLLGEAVVPGAIATARDFNQFMAGKQITFSYNGVTRSIKMPETTDPDYAKLNSTDFAGYLQSRLDSAFGANKINVNKVVSSGNTSLSFTTVDPSSTFKISDADKGIMGKDGLFGIGYATTNRLNREDTLAKSGLVGIPKGFGYYEIDPLSGKKIYKDPDPSGNATGLGTLYDVDGNLKIKVNGKEVKGLTVNSTLLQVTSAINASDAGIKVNYSETADRFSITATNHGEAGKIEFGLASDPDNAGGPTPGYPGQATDFLSALFGSASGSASAGVGYTKIEGQDAIMTVKYEGNVEMNIKRDSNNFNLDGSTFTLTDTFGYEAQIDPVTGLPKKDAAGNIIYDRIPNTENVTFTAEVDTEKVSKVIKELIDDYNKVLDEAFKQVSTKPNRDYGPLTDDEKSQLKSEDIEKLEAKAKEGILFNDPLLRSLSDQLRSVFSGTTDAGTLKEMGIVLSGDYAANGKIGFDEESFKNALKENPDKVKELFTKPAVVDANGDVTDPGGFSVRLKSITDSFAKSTGIPKGSLIDKAGSTSSPTSVLDNALQRQIDTIDDQVEDLKDKLQIEIDRYTRQFSSLEQLISQMNSQSSWLSQAMGG